ncbi:uncharacterized protein LOC116798016 isoform X2 [Chiroxiphia lanceolata]|uniref:uncharacterized protein LOC116798016 isoform X2 n=1 Tax=Chiroxiphia lanceolata TaxID=296741 RepID=UPI0013CE492B|nr:uncharacterized protein LOC116798016 isoform X2 [Chiroxiphia lanceolata]
MATAPPRPRRAGPEAAGFRPCRAHPAAAVAALSGDPPAQDIPSWLPAIPDRWMTGRRFQRAGRQKLGRITQRDSWDRADGIFPASRLRAFGSSAAIPCLRMPLKP